MQGKFHGLTCVALVLASSSAASSQGLQTGSIMGIVRSADGSPRAGIKVVAQSGQIQRDTITNEKGEYRLPLMNPGKWTLTMAHAGFQTCKAAVSLGVNETLSSNFVLKPEATATVEVIGQNPLDLTTAQVSVNLDARMLAETPSSMTSLNPLEAIVAILPGVQTNAGVYTFAGNSHDQNLFTVDGNVANATRKNDSAIITTPREFLETVEIVSGGFGAEYGAMGGVVNMVTKTGGNALSGEVFSATNFPGAMAAPKFNGTTTPPQRAPLPQDKYYRYGATLSGPLVKDKLFFFLGYQGFKDTIPPSTNGGTNLEGLSSTSRTQRGPNLLSFKANWFLSPENQLILSGTRNQEDRDDGITYPSSLYWQSGTEMMGSRTHAVNQSLNLTWNWMISSELYLISSLGKVTCPSTQTPISNPGAAGIYEILDYRYWVSGPGRGWPVKPEGYEYWSYLTGTGNVANAYTDNPSQQFRLDLSWSHGIHQVRAGYARQRTRTVDSQGAMDAYYLFNEIANFDVLGDPTNLMRFHTGEIDTTIRGTFENYYLKDLIELKPGLRLEVGFRFDPFRLVGGTGAFAGVELERFSDLRRQIQPRLGVTWDIANDGKTKLFANWGRFFQAMPLNTVSWITSQVHSVSDWFQDHFTYNQDYASGTPAFTLLTDPATGRPYLPDFTLSEGDQGHAQPRAADLRLPHKDVLTVGADALVAGGWQVGALWTYWTMKDVMETSYFLNADGSLAFSSMSAPVLWNPRPGRVAFLDSNGDAGTYDSPFPEPKQRFISLNLHARGQWERRSLSLDYNWTHAYGNYRGSNVSFSSINTGTPLGTPLSNATGDWTFYRTISSGNLESQPIHVLKAMGTFSAPILGQNLDLSAQVTWQSGFGLSKGIPVGALYNLTEGINTYAADSSRLVQPDNLMGDMGHTPSTLITNLTLGMKFMFARGLAITPTCSILNVFNTRPVLGYYTQTALGFTQAAAATSPNPNFGKVASWQDGRSISAGFSLTF